MFHSKAESRGLRIAYIYSGGKVTPPIRLQFLLSSASHFKSKFQEVQSTSSNDFRLHLTSNFNHFSINI
jgi:hypothetical protein